MMQECDACGLIFGGNDICPSCGSRISHLAEVSDTDGKMVPSGDLPGLNRLVTSMDGVEKIDMETSNSLPPTSLPFSIGGSTGGQTSLPFGVGSPSRGEEEIDDSNDAPTPPIHEEEPEESSNEIVEQVETPEIQIQTPDEQDETPEIQIQTPDEQDETSVEQIPVVKLAQPEQEVMLVARILSDVDDGLEDDATIVEESEIKVFEGSSSSSETINYSTTEGTVEGVDQDVILHEEDIVYHDFGDELQVSEVYVDYDSFVDPATTAVSFDPTVMEGTDPELMPARALAVTGLGDSGLQEQAHIGFAALAQSNWQEAADCFRKICESQPTNAAALNNFGLSLLQQALLVQEERPSQHPADEPHFEASVLALRQAAKASQNDVSVICNLATALSSCHRHDTALKFYDVALSLDSEDVSSINGKAVSMIGIREFDEATELLRHASSLAPDNELISGNLHRISPMG
jgi:tetratricopeptide (TPR) repeat protein